MEQKFTLEQVREAFELLIGPNVSEELKDSIFNQWLEKQTK